MLTNVQKKLNLFIMSMAAMMVAGAAVATAETSYHLVRFPEIKEAGAITDSGIILADNWVDGMHVSMLLEPARDTASNPVWDSDWDGIADGYTVITLNLGAYQYAFGRSINESLDVVGYSIDQDGKWVALLWLNAPAGSPPVELGKTFNADDVVATSINELGQVVVLEDAQDFSDPDWYNWSTTWALSLVNPKDTNGDGAPDLWNEDLNGDGFNDLMINLAFIYCSQPPCSGCTNCSVGSINNYGEVAGMLSDSNENGFVIVPEDTDSDGEPDLWFEDLDGDGWNDLAQDLGSNISTLTFSDSGVVVGTEIVSWKDENFLRWQIDEFGNVDLVAKEDGALYMRGVNNMGQAVGNARKYLGQYQIKFTAYLWEPDLTITNLLRVLDNPSNMTQSLRCSDISNTSCIVGSVYDNYPQDTDAFVAVPIAPSPPGPGPSVDSISPDTMQAGATVDVTIAGSGFQAGATVTFENGRGPAPAANVTSVDGTIIEATVIAHKKAKSGILWDVRVTNPDGSSDVLVDGFTVIQ